MSRRLGSADYLLCVIITISYLLFITSIIMKILIVIINRYRYDDSLGKNETLLLSMYIHVVVQIISACDPFLLL